MKEAASFLEFQARANSFWSAQRRSSSSGRGSRGSRGSRGGNSVYRTRCLPFDVYKLPTAGTAANGKAYALQECECVCAILNVHMFKATWHTASSSSPPLPPLPTHLFPCLCKQVQNMWHLHLSGNECECECECLCESHCMNVWMNEWMSEWMSECQMPVLVSFVSCCCCCWAHA